MPKARIVAVDIDDECAQRARDDGADECHVLDVMSVDSIKLLTEKDKFDAVNLDLCGSVANLVSPGFAGWTHRGLRTRGVLMATFSYGRDVVEVYDDLRRRATAALMRARERLKGQCANCHMWQSIGLGAKDVTLANEMEKLIAAEVPDALIGRILSTASPQRHLVSTLAYQGAEMPMCSLLWHRYQDSSSTSPGYCNVVSFAKVGDDDLEVAMDDEGEDRHAVFACPADRLLAMRRRAAALKAVATRTARASMEQTTMAADVR